MAFPQSPLGIKVQLNLQGLGWTDIVRDNAKGYRILMDDGIDIQRGHSAEESRTTGSSMTCTILDPNGVFNNANPRSPYYGILPRNVPIRCYVQRPLVSFYSPLSSVGSMRTPSAAGMNVAGDLDVTIDFDMTRMRQNPGHMLISKWLTTGNQRQWAIFVNSSGYVTYNYSTDGTNFTTINSTAQLPPTGRVALRVFHDVVNGANNTIFFQTAPTISGSFTALGNSITNAGNVTLFASTASLEIGAGNNGTGTFTGLVTMSGRIYYAQVFNNAVLSAQANFLTKSVGTTSFVDTPGNTWTLTAGGSGLLAEITDADYRFCGEVSSLPQKPDATGKSVKVNLEAAGVIRRLSANATPLRSPIYKNFVNQFPTGYWPLEDGSTATAAGSAVTGSNPAQITDMTFGTDAGLPGSAGVMTCGSSGPVFIGIPKPSTVNATTQASLVFYFKFPSIPVSNLTLASLSISGGTAARLDFVVETTAYRLNVYDSGGTLLVTNGVLFGGGASPNNWIGMNIRIKPSGANVAVTHDWFVVGTNPYVFYSSGAVTYAGTPGRFSKITIQGLAALSGVKLAHILLTQFDFTFLATSFFSYSNGYAGELAGDRWVRVLGDAGVSAKNIGQNTDTEPMGPQPIDTIMNILYECVDVDGGEIIEPRYRLGLDYRTRVNMMNQYGLGLNYGTGGSVKQLSGTLNPVPDDLDISNDITLSRKNGSSVQVTLDSGPMSTLDPTLGGIGRVASTPEINNYADTRLLALAQYMLGVQTWPEARYPTIQIALHRISAFTFYDSTFTLAANTDVGDLFGITNLPIYLPPDALKLLVRGQGEHLTQFTWDITYNATPGYINTSNYLSDQTAEQKRADSSNTVLNAAITSTATSAAFKTTTGALCVTTAANPAEFPFDVMLAGERVTVTAITGTTSPQTATITRSINGIVKAQVINTPVILPVDTAMYVDL